MLKKISAATLTYGNRINFLYQSIDRLLEQGFDMIYVFCNGITKDNYQKLTSKYHGTPIITLYSEKNLGSAGGYYELITHITQNDDADYVLLLDDDNLVPKNCYQTLMQLDIKEDELYYFHRPDRMLPKLAKEKQQPEFVMGSENSFLGRDIFSKIIKSDSKYAGDIIAAPYGGLLLNKQALKSGILPKKDFYLYADDYEYTNRLVTEYNFKIIFSEDILIEDLEKSFHLKKGSKLLSNRFSNANATQLYYSVRNNTWLGLLRSHSKGQYISNVVIFSLIFIAQFLFTFKLNNIGTYLKAIKDGFTCYLEEKKNKPRHINP